MKNCFIFIILFSAVVSCELNAQGTDLRIEKQLKLMKMQFDTTSKGDFKLLFELENNRSQIVFISSASRIYEDAEVRVISSPAKFITKADQLSHDQLWALLAVNSQTVLGSWQLEPATEGFGLHFSVKVPAVMPDKRLLMYMVLVARIADEMEKTFTEDDIF